MLAACTSRVAASARRVAELMLDRVPFAVKATAGLVVFALAPIWSVYSLAVESRKGTLLKPPNTRANLERSFGKQ